MASYNRQWPSVANDNHRQLEVRKLQEQVVLMAVLTLFTAAFFTLTQPFTSAAIFCCAQFFVKKIVSLIGVARKKIFP